MIELILSKLYADKMQHGGDGPLFPGHAVFFMQEVISYFFILPEKDSLIGQAVFFFIRGHKSTHREEARKL